MSLLCFEASWSDSQANPRRFRLEIGQGVLLLLLRVLAG